MEFGDVSDPADMIRKNPHKSRAQEYQKFCRKLGRHFYK